MWRTRSRRGAGSWGSGRTRKSRSRQPFGIRSVETPRSSRARWLRTGGSRCALLYDLRGNPATLRAPRRSAIVRRGGRAMTSGEELVPTGKGADLQKIEPFRTSFPKAPVLPTFKGWTSEAILGEPLGTEVARQPGLASIGYAAERCRVLTRRAWGVVPIRPSSRKKQLPWVMALRVTVRNHCTSDGRVPSPSLTSTTLPRSPCWAREATGSRDRLAVLGPPPRHQQGHHNDHNGDGN